MISAVIEQPESFGLVGLVYGLTSLCETLVKSNMNIQHFNGLYMREN